MHTPLWLCPLLDVLGVKKRDVLVRHVPSPVSVLAAAGNLHGLLWSIDLVKLRVDLQHVYPWLYDIDALGYGLFGHMALHYAALWVPVGAVFMACRKWILRRGAEFAVGAAVEARWEDGNWYAARISAAGAGGYGLAADDGHTESGVSGDRVRTAKKAAKKAAATPAPREEGDARRRRPRGARARR